MINASSLSGELDGGTTGKRCGQKLRCMNQRGAIPEGESSKKHTETPVEKTDRRLVCPFLPVSWPFRVLSPYGSDLGQSPDPFADPDCFGGEVEEKRDFQGCFGVKRPIFW